MAKGWRGMKAGKGRSGTGGWAATQDGDAAAGEDRSDIYQRVTDRIVASIEAGAATGDWRMPWHGGADGQASAVPCNVATGKPYRGVNVLALWAAAQAGGYGSGTWATYRQWREIGAQVRKGEQASPVVFWRLLDEGDGDGAEGGSQGGDDDGEASGRRRLLARGYSVFNAAQVDGYDAPALPALPEAQRIAHAEVFFAALGAAVEHGGNRASYIPAQDKIRMPDFGLFRDAVAYYGTYAHEATHWAGHSSRCARDLTGRFGSEAYAAEELVAELGAAFLCADLRLASEPRSDHAQYVASWLNVLRGDKRAVFTAAAKAQAAADWMHSRQSGAGVPVTMVPDLAA